MKNVAASILTLFILTQCHEANDEPSSAALFIGSWKNVANEHTIAFDEDHNYAVKFRSDTAFQFKYRLDVLEENPHLFIYDGKLSQEYAYRFLDNDQLELTQIFSSEYPDMEKHVGIFQRVR